MTDEPRPSQVLADHREEVLRIAKEHNALSVRVFGSVARGEDQPGSDLDLLVRFGPDASQFDQIELEQDLEDLLGVRVDLVSEGGLRSPHHDHIGAEARPL